MTGFTILLYYRLHREAKEAPFILLEKCQMCVMILCAFQTMTKKKKKKRKNT
jgi:hypothetical protein